MLDHALAHPCHGQLRVEQELRLRGLQVSAGGIRGVWMRHGLLTKHDRLLRLEKATAERTLDLSDEQVQLLERFSPEFRERHIEAPQTGSMVAVDTFFVGVLKGGGKVYLQTAIDCHSRRAWARLYTSKLLITAVHLLNEDVLPAYDAADIRIETVLSDNGREFCGRPDRHPYELFLQLEGIDHRTTRVKRPQSTDVIDKRFQNGHAVFCSRARMTARRRAGYGVKALPRSLYGRSSFAAPVRAFLGPRGFQPATKRA